MGDSDSEVGFHEMELDDRILKAIAKLGWREPTLIQEKTIPLLLEGKDVLMRARTGSGKTAAFAIPIIQKILYSKETAAKQSIKALMLAPSRELCKQIFTVVKQLTSKCSTEVKCVNIGQDELLKDQRPFLAEKPDIVISTPSRVLDHLEARNMVLNESLEMLIIDEADLVLSFGFQKEISLLTTHLPTIYQAALASATLNEDVNSLKSLILHNPVILKLEESDLPTTKLAHYVLLAEELEKATILCTLLKLNLIQGKTIIFVNKVDKCYQIKLFLEQFAIKCCTLNSELPATIRCHTVNQFNDDLYNIIIAADEKFLIQPGQLPVTQQSLDKLKKSKRKKDRESGVSRGIDFQNISNVINFDFPVDIPSYIHRAGRTARADEEGNVLSFVGRKEMEMYEKVNEKLKKMMGQTNDVFKKYDFNLEEVEAFKYRSRDAWKSVTRAAVRDARLKEIKQEILNSQKLKGYFENNPNDTKVLRHDKFLHTVRIQHHLANVPDYIIPEALKDVVQIEKPKASKRGAGGSQSTEKSRKKKRMSNPLFSMKFEGMPKNKRKQNK